jgi:2-polyprenyl-3-methyl-5-hydroxy-6-metoxy-1,4-benzoquinol methylase
LDMYAAQPPCILWIGEYFDQVIWVSRVAAHNGRIGMSGQIQSRLEPQQILSSTGEERAVLAIAMAAVASPTGELRVLEAGCGQKWPIQMPELQLHITGIDLDAEALQMRQARQGDLDEAIVGDLRDVSLPPNAFDVAYCAFVLEHVAGAEAVLSALVAAVRPGGRVVILVPNGRSVYGFVSKHAPFRAAVFYKKHIEGFKNAGKPGHAPYPTVYDPIVTLSGMRDYARRTDLTIIEEYGIDYVSQNFARARTIVRWGMEIVAAGSRGRLTASHNNLGFVLERPTG